MVNTSLGWQVTPATYPGTVSTIATVGDLTLNVKCTNAAGPTEMKVYWEATQGGNGGLVFYPQGNGWNSTYLSPANQSSYTQVNVTTSPASPALIQAYATSSSGPHKYVIGLWQIASGPNNEAVCLVQFGGG
jgi:hypothetical protein